MANSKHFRVLEEPFSTIWEKISFLYQKIALCLVSTSVFAVKAFPVSPTPGELLLFFLLALLPFVFFLVNSIVLIVNLKKRQASLRRFGYLALTFQGIATLFWILKMPWIGVMALALVAVQGFVTLRTF